MEKLKRVLEAILNKFIPLLYLKFSSFFEKTKLIFKLNLFHISEMKFNKLSAKCTVLLQLINFY